MSAKKGRSYEKQFEVAAPPEAVWKAITDGEELTRWFCLEASCEAGVGGHHHIDWGGGAEATHVVTIWEPNAHLRTEAVRPVRGRSSQFDSNEPYAIDWYLEHEGGLTRVRMVASGFGDGPEWDQEYEGTYYGWDLFHKTLIHYLENHRGRASKNVVLYAVLSDPPDRSWPRLFGSDGLVGEGDHDDLTIGAPFRFKTRHGDVLAGVVRNSVAGKTFSALVENLNKAILNIEMTSVPGSGHFLYLSLTTWGLPKEAVDALGDRLKSIVFDLFPQPTENPFSPCAPADTRNEPTTSHPL